MLAQLLLGLSTFITGIVLVVIGTDFGRIINVTVGVIAGSVFILLGMARLKYVWVNWRDRER